MKVNVYAPGFVNRKKINADNTVILPTGATVRDLFAFLNLPEGFRYSLFCSVNDIKADWEWILTDGDKVVFMFPISGG
jgi:molybdopterin converting factor small subunit